jgi:hypothetical protein
MDYDIYHATIDAMEDGSAQQEYYVRWRSTDAGFDRQQAEMLRVMLESSIQVGAGPPGSAARSCGA